MGWHGGLVGIGGILLVGACSGGAAPADVAVAARDPDAGSGSTRNPPTQLRISNWNVKNFFDDQANNPAVGAPCPPDPESDAHCEDVPSSDAYEQKLSALGAVLAPLDADVIVLPETESLVAATALAARLGGRPYVTVSEGNDPRGIEIAVISRLPFDRVVSHASETFGGGARSYRFARDCLELHLTVNARHVVLLGVHFKAMDDAASQAKRSAEATHVRALAAEITAADPSAALVVLGDFNATPDEEPVQILLGSELDRYYSAAALVPEAERATYDDRLLFDDQISNASLYDLVRVDSVSVVHGPAVTAASDHEPLTADYAIE